MVGHSEVRGVEQVYIIPFRQQVRGKAPEDIPGRVGYDY